MFDSVPNPEVTGSGTTAAVGDAATLMCSTSSMLDGTTVTYQWKKSDMTKISGATSGTYQVSSSVGVSDAGVYTCQVTISDAGGSQHVISGTSSLGIALTVTSKW